MKKYAIAATVLVAGLALTGCSSSSNDAGSTSTKSASSEASVAATPTKTAKPVTSAAIAESVQAAVPTVTKVTEITEANDLNNLIGRPTGYSQATTLYDSGVSCDELGASCGATVEVWPTAAAAQKRSDYIQGIYKESPALGSEYDYVHGTVVLRVSGEIKPSVAATYEAAFNGYFA